MTLDQSEYLARRLRSLKQSEREAKANLALARAHYFVRATPRARANVVRSIANLMIAQAFIEALEGTK